MKNLFDRTSSNWMRYSQYEWKQSTDGVLYITPTSHAIPKLYDPLKEAEQLVLDAVGIGIHCMNQKKSEEEGQIKNEVLNFITNYGFLGFMTALPSTPEFINYEAVYLPKNHFIKEERLSVEEYLSYFFPFEKINFQKWGRESNWNVTDKYMMAAIMAMPDKPQSLIMSFQKEYAERYDWLITMFKDWAFTFFSSFLYYQDFHLLDDMQKDLYRQGMAAFGGTAPTYHIILAEKGPQIVWDFHSLLLGIQMMFSFMLTDKNAPLKVCKQCTKAFIADNPQQVFCTSECEKDYNIDLI